MNIRATYRNNINKKFPAKISKKLSNIKNEYHVENKVEILIVNPKVSTRFPHICCSFIYLIGLDGRIFHVSTQIL